MTKLRTHFKHNVVAYLALFVALGGTSYAAIALPVGSVGTRQLRNGAVTNGKLARGSVGAANLSHNSIAGYVRDWATIGPQGQIVASEPRAHVVFWDDAPGTQYPRGLVTWNRPSLNSCFPMATAISAGLGATYASTSPFNSKKHGGAYVQLSTPQTSVNVAVICPQP